jgi:hypothetical protein
VEPNELSGGQRQDARPGLVKIYGVPPARLGGLPLTLCLSKGLGSTLHTRCKAFVRAKEQDFYIAQIGKMDLAPGFTGHCFHPTGRFLTF